MKHIFTTIAAFATAAAIFSGCIKETMPQGSTRTAAQLAESPGALKAMADALPANIGMANFKGYLSGYNVHFDCGLPGFHGAFEAMLEDIATLGSNVWYNRFHAHGFGRLTGQEDSHVNTHWFWECYYGWIKGTNDIIGTIDKSTTDPTIQNYLGTAYLYRAMFYLDMARLYEFKENKYTTIDPSLLKLTVPIVTDETTDEQAKNNPRAPRSELYALIISDLENAEKYIDPTANLYNVATLGAVYAQKARTYIEMTYWDDAEANYADSTIFYAQKAIDVSGRTPLTQAQWTDPTDGFNNGAKNNSWIWGIKTSTENLGNLTSFTAHMSCEALWGYGPLSQIGASKKFYDRIPESDWRKLSWLSPEFLEDPLNGPLKDKYQFAVKGQDKIDFLSEGNSEFDPAAPYESIKFRPAQGECNDYPVGGTADHALIRVEEMHFLKAEAQAAKNDLASATATLSELVKTRNAEYAFSASSKDLFLEEMLFQKRIEFWGEGILIFDYKRLNKGVEKGYAGSNVPSVLWYNTIGRSPEWNFVIPRGEHQYNEALSEKNNNPVFSNSVTLWAE